MSAHRAPIVAALAFAAAGCSSGSPMQSIRLVGTAAIDEAAIREHAAGCADVDDCRTLISEKYLREGYVSASIVFEQSLLERWMRSKGGTFVIAEGPRYSLGELVFTEPQAPPGDPLGDPAALAGLTPLTAGKPFRSEDIRAHLDAITARYAAAGFAAVNVSPLSTIDPDAHTVSMTFEIDRGARAPTSQPN